LETDPDNTKAAENEAEKADRAEQARIRAKADEVVLLGPVDPAVQARLGDHGDLLGTTTRRTVIYTHAGAVGVLGSDEGDVGSDSGGDGINTGLLSGSDGRERDSLVPGRTESFVTAMTRVDLKEQDGEDGDDGLERDEVGGAEHRVDKEVGDVIGAGADAGEAGVGVIGTSTSTSQPTSAVPVPPPATTTATTTPGPAPASTPGPSLQFATSSSTKQQQQQQQQQQAKEKEKEKTTSSLKTWWKGFSGGGSGSSNNATTSGNTPGNNLASTSSSGGHGGNPTTGTTTTTAGTSTGAPGTSPSDQTPTTSGGLGMRLRKGSVGGEGLRGRKSSVGEGYNYLAETVPEGDVFAQPLLKSLEYASVQISTARPDGGLFIWG